MTDNPDLNPAVAPEPEPGRGAVPGSGPESAPDFLPPPPDPGISEIGPPDEVASNRPGPTPTGRVVDAMAKWLPKFARRVHQVVLASMRNQLRNVEQFNWQAWHEAASY